MPTRRSPVCFSAPVSTDPAHILVVDDEPRIRDVVAYAISKEGYRVTQATGGDEALALLRRGPFDLVVLDVGLPDKDGLSVCRELRTFSEVPVLFLSARNEEIDRVIGLEVGGDDYLDKPFGNRELVARVRALLRRAQKNAASSESNESLRVGRVTLKPDQHEARCDDVPVKLTPTEMALLAALFTRPGIVLSRGQLVDRAYAVGHHVTERAIDTHVRRLRAKFRAHSVDPIETVHGLGYKARVASE